MKNPLPEFYYYLSSVKGVRINTLRRLEKSVWKTEKKKRDIIFLERCLDLDVLPQFLKFKNVNLKLLE